MASWCGSVGRAVASESRSPNFESSQLRNSYRACICCKNKNEETGAVVVAQLEERLLLTQEVHSSDPVNCKIHTELVFTANCC